MRLKIVLVSLLCVLIPYDVEAAGYRVQRGDTLASIASRYHISVATLARANLIQNPNLIQAGRFLVIPPVGASVSIPSRYRIRWGDTLIGIAARFHMTVASVRALNPYLGTYLIAGRMLTLASTSTGSSAPPAAIGGSRYVVRPGDNLSTIAYRYGLSVDTLMTANGMTNPDVVTIGSVLAIPAATGAPVVSTYDPSSARVLIERYAAYYGLPAALPLAIADEESGFNESALSVTGAVGVMQVEPYTVVRIDAALGLRLNLYNIDDNIHAGVYWLAALLRYYGGDQRLAVAAYYEGARALARHGMYSDTVQYVNNVMALETRFAA